jgi:RNA polymerase sigma-70 factor (ECF subfamily)
MRKIRNRAAFWRAERRNPAGEAVPLDLDAALENACRTISSPSEAAGGREFIERFESVFDRLSDDDREVILLSRVVGLTHAEIAQQTGRSEGACRVLLHRALGRLAELLDE